MHTKLHALVHLNQSPSIHSEISCSYYPSSCCPLDWNGSNTCTTYSCWKYFRFVDQDPTNIVSCIGCEPSATCGVENLTRTYCYYSILILSRLGTQQTNCCFVLFYIICITQYSFIIKQWSVEPPLDGSHHSLGQRDLPRDRILLNPSRHGKMSTIMFALIIGHTQPW